MNPLEPTEEDKERQTIVPPPTMDGYWLVPYGMPGAGSTNTTYIAGHSWQDREAPFNRLSTNAAAGDRLTLTTQPGELAYQVDSVTTFVKSGLKDSAIWDVVPHRLSPDLLLHGRPVGDQRRPGCIAHILRHLDQHMDDLATLKA